MLKWLAPLALVAGLLAFASPALAAPAPTVTGVPPVYKLGGVLNQSQQAIGVSVVGLEPSTNVPCLIGSDATCALPGGGGGGGSNAAAIAGGATVSGTTVVGLTGLNFAGAAKAWTGDTNGYGDVNVMNVPAGAIAAGAGVDGWDVTEGTKADTAWVSGSGSVVSILKAAVNDGLTSTPVGGTVTTAGTFQTGLAASATRKGCLIQNRSVDTELVFFGANGSATEAKSFALGPAAIAGGAGGAIGCSAGGPGQAQDNIAITSLANNGAAYTVNSQ